MSDLIIKGARENNLKSINLLIPDEKITVVVGPSGSGKSSLVFDTIYAEGQRRYIESLSSYARQFLEKIDKPNVEYIDNISPSIAVEQKNRVKSSRGTVSSMTEIYDYLKLLFSKVGKIYCPDCKIYIKRYTVEAVVNDLLKNNKDDKVYIVFKTKATKQELLMSGFMRVLIDDKMYDLSEDEVNLPDEYYVIYDRFIIQEDDINRIWESIEKTISYGNRECIVFFPDSKTFKSFPFDNSCPSCKKVYTDPDPRLFSFDSPIGACPACKGFGNILRVDEDKIVPDKKLSLLGGAVELFNKPSLRHIFHTMINFMKEKGVNVNVPFNELSEKQKSYLYTGGGKGKNRFYGINRVFEELERKRYKVYVRVLLNKYKTAYTCELCNGTRLVSQALNVLIAGKNIADLNSMSVSSFYAWLSNLDLTDNEKKISHEIMKQLLYRTSFVSEIGLSYLTLNRLAKTLSNGEAQRINLANQLGLSLVDTIYVLDEPTIGLHPRDVGRLTGIIKKIRDNGNKVIVVEHDMDVINSCDHVIELGPKSGIKGGHVVFEGSIQDFRTKANTLTSSYIKNKEELCDNSKRTIGVSSHFLVLEDINQNNLKSVTLNLPLNRFVCVTGVSGSGKSSLITKGLYPVLKDYFSSDNKTVNNNLKGIQNIRGVMLIDQSGLTRSSRSTPITFISGFDHIRDLFAQTPLARSRGYSSSHFSFNVKEGQCSACNGEGRISVDMQFMADINMRCEVCNGTRYKKEILDVRYKEKNIHEVLNLTVKEAYGFFMSSPQLRIMLKLLIDVGLDYLVIGQPAESLSGGEAQRLKICKELITESSKKKKTGVLYIMDEPTTGLHPSEVERLLIVIQRLVEEGNSVLVIEHNMGLVRCADYVIDLGPEAGEEGGKIIAEGTPMEIAQSPISYTGRFLCQNS
jgi:excinuclease ABC subunit A